MSQYPPGYPPPYPMPYYAMPMTQPDPGAHGRRACILMIVVGIVALLMAGCVGVTAAMLPSLNDMPELQQSLSQLENQAGFKASTLMIVAAVVFGIVALVQIILGILVRGGGLVSAVLAIVFTSIMLIYSAINFVASLAISGQLGGACLSAGMAVVFGVQLILLIYVCRNAKHVAWLKQGAFAPQAAWPPPQPYVGPAGTYPPGMPQGYGYGSVPAPPPPPQQPPADPQNPPNAI